jgi:hypothetical protein
MTLQEKLHHQRQIANAIQRGDKTYQLTPTNLLESLPTPQVCGTLTQQRTYAMDRALEILMGI